ncbi:MAG: hypothetical protein Q7S96_01345 [bacterium]|nr:hypothetical protein [bacterium]
MEPTACSTLSDLKARLVRARELLRDISDPTTEQERTDAVHTIDIAMLMLHVLCAHRDAVRADMLVITTNSTLIARHHGVPKRTDTRKPP